VKPAALLAACALACAGEVAEPRAQWRVSVGTDAPVPQFGDRLLVEVLDPDARSCPGCRRQFGVSGDQLPLSFGIAAPAGDGEWRIRARLYRAIRTGPDGLPQMDGVIDRAGKLPPPTAVVDVSLALPMSCFGIEGQPAAHLTCDPDTGELAPEAVLGSEPLPAPNSWAPARDVPCPGPAPEGMACVPGGAFLLGGDGVIMAFEEQRPVPEQIVQLSPYALDLDEITVGRIRQLRAGGLLNGKPRPRNPDPLAKEAHCTYPVDESDSSFDAHPVNCLSRQVAEQACAALGKRLPTEAEWEYAAGNRAAETPYAWGYDDLDICRRAWVGHGRHALEIAFDNSIIEEPDCRHLEDVIGPVAGGHPEDVSLLGFRNLAGNVSEWVQDSFVPFTDDACWNAGSTLLVDPRCDAPTGKSITKGGSWSGTLSGTRSVRRAPYTLMESPTAAGFRCAVSFD
jgi:formylglycine-generating enzyme